MPLRLLSPAENRAPYDEWVKKHPQGSLWQSEEWKSFQEALGRTTRTYVHEKGGAIEASALVIIDRTQFGLSTWEIPRGPLFPEKSFGETGDSIAMADLLRRVSDDAREDRCMALYMSPTRMENLSLTDWRHSTRHVHPEATRQLDLSLDSESLLAQMKQKGRYNIGVAQRHGVRVEESQDAAAFAALASATGKRDGFTPHSARHYGFFLEHLQNSFLLLAYSPTESKPIAGLIGVIWNGIGIYYYGASNHAHRPLMAPYLLQWEAMRFCKERGCTRYDLFGIAPENQPNHPWAGVTDFKAKFGGEYMEYPREQELVLKPVAKKMLEWKRKILG